MFASLRVVIVLVFGFFASLAALAADGVQGGNTELFRPRNSKGELIEIKLSEQHPQQQQLFNLIHKADLPPSLKSEMLADLANTAVMYSSEIISYADIQRQMQLSLSKVVRTRTKNADGTTTETTREEYTPTEAASALGIHISPINMHVHDLSNVLVAAYTHFAPRRVVYFSKLIEKMSARESMRIVLHEQGHRLSALSAYSNDERFIEGWSAELVKHLHGELAPGRFAAMLAKHQIARHAADKIEGERYSGNGYFEANINVTIAPEQVVHRGIAVNSYQLQVIKSVFKDYRPLQEGDYVNIELGSSNTYAYEAIEGWLKETIDQGETINLPLRLKFRKDVSNDSFGRRLTTLHFAGEPEYWPSEKYALMIQRFNSIMSKHFPKSKMLAGTNSSNGIEWFRPMLFNPRSIEAYNVYLSSLDQALSSLAIELPHYKDFFENVGSIDLHFSYDTASGINANHENLQSRDDGCLIVGVNVANPMRDVTVQALKRQFADLISNPGYAGWKAFEALNSRLKTNHVSIEPTGKAINDNLLTLTALNSNPALFARLNCLGNQVAISPFGGKLLMRVRISDNDTQAPEWQYSWTGECKDCPSPQGAPTGLELTVHVGKRALANAPRSFADFVLNTILTSEAVESSSDYFGGGTAEWISTDATFKLDRKQRMFSSRRHEAILNACSKPRRGH